MKTKFLPIAYCMLLTCYAINGNAQTGITKFGTNALANNTTGDYNSAFGYWSLFFNNTGVRNTAVGSSSLFANKDGFNNSAVGFNSLRANTSGSSNTANGAYSLYSNTTGFGNSASSGFALYYNKTGNENTASGAYSLYYNTTGSYNTALGHSADVSNGNLTNATAIGYNASVDASNKVRIGNTSVTKIEGQVNWSVFSDGRYKKNIKENIEGLAFINSLRPISYSVDVQGLNAYNIKGRKEPGNLAIDERAQAVLRESEEKASKVIYNGFIAQEVEQAAKKLNYAFSGVDKPESEEGLYSLRYSDFVVPLVKAVQELSKTNDELKSEIRNLKSEIDELKSSAHPSNSLTTNLGVASLDQNVPNPFTTTTTINYRLPSKFSTAQIIIMDKNGKQLKQWSIPGSGKGSLNVDASTLSSGTYNYSLIMDGRIISSKQMLLIK